MLPQVDRNKTGGKLSGPLLLLSSKFLHISATSSSWIEMSLKILVAGVGSVSQKSDDLIYTEQKNLAKRFALDSSSCALLVP